MCIRDRVVDVLLVGGQLLGLHLQLRLGVDGLGVRAVSYTHLDVYKRQTVGDPVGKRALEDNRHRVAGLRIDEDEAVALTRGLKPVSYTHLDVYKRQSRYSAELR